MCQTYTVRPSLIEEHARRIWDMIHADDDWISLDAEATRHAETMNYEQQETALEQMTWVFDTIVAREVAALPDTIQNHVAVQINMIAMRASKVGQ